MSWKGFGLAVGLALPFPALAEALPALCPADPDLALAIAGADLVVVATLVTPVAELSPRKEASYRVRWLRDEVALKGDVVRPVVLNASFRLSFSKAAAESFDAVDGQLDALEGKPAILALTATNLAMGVYDLARGDAMGGASPERLAKVKAEVDRQKDVVANWPAVRDVDAKVAALIEQLGRAENEDQVFWKLMALSPEATPTISTFLSERRPLKSRSVYVPSDFPGPHGGEGAVYHPEVVADALFLVLEKINRGGPSAATLNGGPESLRQIGADAWRVYAHDMACAPKPPAP